MFSREEIVQRPIGDVSPVQFSATVNSNAVPLVRSDRAFRQGSESKLPPNHPMVCWAADSLVPDLFSGPNRSDRLVDIMQDLPRKSPNQLSTHQTILAWAPSVTLEPIVRLFCLATPPNCGNPCGEQGLFRKDWILRARLNPWLFEKTTPLGIYPGCFKRPFQNAFTLRVRESSKPTIQPLFDSSELDEPPIGLEVIGSVTFGGTGLGSTASASLTSSCNCSPRNFAAIAAC